MADSSAQSPPSPSTVVSTFLLPACSITVQDPWRLPECHAGRCPDLRCRRGDRDRGHVGPFRPRGKAARVHERGGAPGTLGFPLVLARQHRVRPLENLVALYSADFPGHDVWATGCALLGDVQRSGTLLGSFDRLPGRFGLRAGLAPIIMVWLLESTGTSL